MTFTGGKIDVGAELQIDGVWTDETDYLYTRAAIALTYGRSDEGTAVAPSSCALTLNNRDGRFSNRNPSSPLFGLIGRNTPMRVTVPGPTYLETGSSGNGASTPDASALDITGDLDLRIELTTDWTAAGSHMLLSKYLPTGDQRSWLLAIGDGSIEFDFSTDGTSSVNFAAKALPVLPQRAALRMVFDVDNGAGGWDVTFYWAESIAGPWTQIDEPAGITETTSIFSSTAPVAIGNPSGSIAALDGKVHAVEIRNSAGTVVASPDFTEQTAGTTSFTDDAGRVWTLTGASISDRWIRLTTEVPRWPQEWDTSGADRWTSVTGAGVMRRLGQGAKALDSTLRRRIPFGDPVAYWPMEEAQGTTQAWSPIGGVSPLKTTGMDFAADDSLPGSGPLPSLGQAATLSAHPPRALAGAWHIELAYNLPALPATAQKMIQVNLVGGVISYLTVTVSTAAIKLSLYADDGTLLNAVSYTTAAGLAAFPAVWNRLQLFTYTSGGDAFVSVAWRDVAGDTWYYAYAPTAGAHGAVSSVTGSWGADFQSMALGHLGVFAVGGTSQTTPGVTIYEDADSGFAGESALTRIARVADEEGLLRFTADGDNTVSATRMGPQKPAKLLDVLQDCADADRGILCEDRELLGVRYRDRSSLYNQTPTLVLDYTASGEIGPPLTPVEDDQGLRNDVTVTRQGGSSGRYIEEEGPLSVLPPPDGVGTYDESVTLNLYDDSQPIQQAGWSVHLGTWDEARYPTVRLMLHAAPHLIPDFLRIELGDTIRIINTPDWLPPGPVDLMVQGVAEQIGPYTWDVTLNCTAAGPWTVGEVAPDDGGEGAGPGRADTAGSILATDVTSTATTVSVSTVTGPEWTADLTDLPMDIRVGGEVMTVTSITGDQGDRFERSVTSGWGTATSGQAWSTSGGSSSDFSVQGG